MAALSLARRKSFHYRNDDDKPLGKWRLWG
jgi:hypothetical protein